ncbi:hypothetical protein FKM82_027737 [Ascaphus truei]
MDLLPSAEFSHNNLRNKSTQDSPFFINFGFHPSALPTARSGSGVPAADNRILLLQDSWAKIQENLKRAVSLQKRQADQHRHAIPVYNPGQKVWLSTRNIHLKVPMAKFAPRYIRPFPVIEVNPVDYRLRLPSSMKIPSVFHSSLHNPFIQDPESPASMAPREPLLVEGQQEYKVQAVLDPRLSCGKIQYLVNWRGFVPEEHS